jgi:hypothetical protein
MKLAKDGSLYLGPRYVNISGLGHGVAHRLDDKHFHVSYSDIAEITDTKIIDKAKLSFHSSGTVNAPMGRTIRNPLRTLKGQELLCVVVFQHPKHFTAVSVDKVLKRDVCLRYPIDENRPLWACLYIAPRHKVIPVTHISAIHQITLLFAYPPVYALDIALQLAVCHGPEGTWPPYTYLIFEATDLMSNSLGK